MRSRRVTVAAGGVLFFGMAASVLLLLQVDQVRTGATLQEALYISSPKLLKRLSLGYDGLLADVYWTRAVQYYGTMHHNGGGDYGLLAPLLNITTQLDPHLIPAYQFGGTFLSAKPPQGAGLPQKAIELVEYGIRNNPGDWHLYYDLGFIYYMDLKDYPGAAQAFLRGSQVPNAHPFLKILAAQMAEHGGDPQTAQMLWSATYQTTHDEHIKANAAAHLRALQVDQDVSDLERVVEIYRQRMGQMPSNFQDMVAAGLLRGLPSDPLGKPYQLEHGKVVVSDPDDLPFVENGLPADYNPSAVPKILPAK